jgi:hypothetical protein
MVFIKGKYIGGFTQLQQLVADGDLLAALGAAQAPSDLASSPLQWGDGAERLRTAKLCVGADGREKVWCFQFTAYGNVVRLLSLLHVAVFCAGLALLDAHPRAALLLLLVLCVDLTVNTLFGASPFSLLGTPATFCVWK